MPVMKLNKRVHFRKKNNKKKKKDGLCIQNKVLKI